TGDSAAGEGLNSQHAGGRTLCRDSRERCSEGRTHADAGRRRIGAFRPATRAISSSTGRNIRAWIEVLGMADPQGVEVPQTLEGWFILHDVYHVDWPRWHALPGERRQQVADEAVHWAALAA